MPARVTARVTFEESGRRAEGGFSMVPAMAQLRGFREAAVESVLCWRIDLVPQDQFSHATFESTEDFMTLDNETQCQVPSLAGVFGHMRIPKPQR